MLHCTEPIIITLNGLDVVNKAAVVIGCLTIIAFWADLADDKLTTFLFYFLENRH